MSKILWTTISGSIDEARLSYYRGRDVMLNPLWSGEHINYIMYPYAEVDGRSLNEDLLGFNIGYKITFSENNRTIEGVGNHLTPCPTGFKYVGFLNR